MPGIDVRDRDTSTAGTVLGGDTWRGSIHVGSWIAGTGGTVTVRDKATGAALAEAGLASPDDVRAAARTAAAAQPGWADLPGEKRADVLRRAAGLFEEHRDETVRWLCREGGATRRGAAGSVTWCVGRLHATAALCTEPTGQLLSTDGPETSIARRVPVGVVGVITPWNGPLSLAVRAVAPALALGNTVVLKPDAQTPVSGGAFLAEILFAAGLPADAFAVVPGGPDVGEAIVSDPDIAMISFTGSTAVGRRIGAAAGERLKRVSLELGGNNATIVLDDADVERAAELNAFASFVHQGQVCMATGRHLVHRRVAAAYRDALVAIAERTVVGDPWTADVGMGPLISRDHVDRVDDVVQRTVHAGGTVLTGGRRADPFYPPTVIDGVEASMPAFAEEVFGPVAPLTVCDTEDDLFALAAQTEYGLAASIHTGRPLRALTLSAHLRAGMVHINGQTVQDRHTAPMGGFGASGNGARFGPQTHLDEYTQWQWVTVRDPAPSP